MLGKEVKSHLIVVIFWLVLVTVIHVNYQGNYLLQAEKFLLFWMGGIFGTFLIDIDQYIYALFTYPHELNSQRIKHLVDSRKFEESLRLIVDTAGERTRLMLHNFYFQSFLVILCFFTLTSTVGYFGKGLVMGMALHLLKDEVLLLLKRKDEFLRSWLFWPIKGTVSFENQKRFVIGMIFVFIFFSLFVI